MRRARRLHRWTAALLVGISCCAGDHPADLKAADVTDRTRIYLVQDDPGGREGSCSAKAEPIEVTLPGRRPALEGALEALLRDHDPYDERSGLYNALAGSRLELDRVERAGPEARVHLKGYLEVGDRCDGPRVLAQLTETALQFSDVEHAQVYLDGKPLRDLLPRR